MGQHITYAIDIDGNIRRLEDKLKVIKQSMTDTFGEGNAPKEMQKVIDSITSKLDILKTKAATPVKSGNAFDSMEKDVHAIETSVDNLNDAFESFKRKTTKQKFSLLPEDEQNKVKGVIGQYEKLQASAQKIVDLRKQQATQEEKINTLGKQRDDKKSEKEKADAIIEQYKNNEKLYQSIKKTAEARKAEAEAQGKTYDPSKARFDDGNGGRVSYTVAVEGLKELDQARTTSKELQAGIQQLQGQIGRAKTTFDGLGTSLKEEQATFLQLRQKAEQLGLSLEGIGTEGTKEDIDALSAAIEGQMQGALEGANTNMERAAAANRDLGQAAKETTGAIKEQTQAYIAENEAQKEVDGILSRIKHLTGLAGVMQVLRRTIRAAFQSTKELDEQMTEMAVVTNFEVGDFWKQMPQHTEAANKLGVAIKDVYEAETLYYQQGLKAAQVQEVANTTLKMARIAGLSAEDATNKMTAALRGFNMEVNKTNADRVADVYSKLAAITASDVNEISSAMTKTASIAANAGMEFETTAAFLSQIIETTRESAETAGTALKTVIARFQELKKSPDEIGEVDGEIVDANKIETALRSVGIALRDTKGQFRELDDVFLELSGKWDSLDTNTQRYIATIAAGSRQQSRFIAMMSNNARTQELVQAANTAAGASNEQFGKTLDSLESKLAQLKNAWTEFTQGIMNSGFIKTAVDLLTLLLQAVNKLTSGFGLWEGTLVSSALRIGLLVVALIGARKALIAFQGSMVATNKNISKSLGAGFKAPIQALKNYVANLKTTVITMDKIAKVQVEYNAAIKTYGKGSEQAAAAQEALCKTLLQTSGIQELTNDQKAIANNLTQIGISQNTASMAALGGLTSERWDAIRAQMVEDGLTEDQINDNMRLIAANYAQTGAEQIKSKAKKKGIIATIASTIATQAHTMAEMLGIPVGLAYAAVIGIITLAVAALVIGIMLLVKHFKECAANTPEGKLEAANAQLKAASELANDAADAYSNLKDRLDSINEKYTNIKKLTAGTQEWRDAVQEVNNEVMELIDKYPDLIGYITQEDGIFIISKKGQEAAKNAANQKVSEANNARLYAQTSQKDAQVGLTNKMIQKDKYGSLAVWASEKLQAIAPIIGAIQGLLYGPMAGAIAGGGLSTLGKEASESFYENVEDSSKEIIEKLKANPLLTAEDLGLTKERFTAIKEYSRALQEQEKFQEQATQAMLNNAAAMVDTTNMTAEQVKAMQQITTEAWDNAQKQAEKVVADLEGFIGIFDSFNDNAEYMKWAKETYGASASVDKHGEITKEDGTKVTAEAAHQQFIAAETTKKVANQMVHIPKLLDRAGKASAIGRAMQDREGKDLTEAQITELRDTNKLKEYAKANKADIIAVYGSLEKFYKDMEARADLADKGFEYNRNLLKSYGMGTSITGISSGAQKGLYEHLTEMSIKAGTQGAEDMAHKLKAYIQSIPEPDRNNVIAQLNSIDWNNAGDIEGLKQKFLDLGLSIEGLDPILSQIKTSMGALHNIDLKAMQDELINLQKITKNINKGEQSRIFEEADYKALVKSIPDLKNSFLKTADGYVYISGSMDTLKTAIEQNTEALLEESQQVIQSKINLSTLIDRDKMAKIGSDTKQQRQMLIDLRKEAMDKGYDLSGVKGLSEFTPLDTLPDKDIAEMFASLYKLDPAAVEALARDNNQLIIQSWANVMASEDIETLVYSKEFDIGKNLDSTGEDYKKWEKKNKTNIEKTLGVAQAIGGKAAAAGITEAELGEYDELMKDIQYMIDNNLIGTDKWIKKWEKLQVVAQRFGSIIGYKEAKKNAEDLLNTLKTGFEDLTKATTLEDKMIAIQNMANKFGLTITKENVSMMESLFSALYSGNEQAFKQLIDLMGAEEGSVIDTYSTLAGKTEDQIIQLAEKSGIAWKELADTMINTDLAYYDAKSGQLTFIFNQFKKLRDKLHDDLKYWENSYTWLDNANSRLEAGARLLNHYANELNELLESSEATMSKILEVATNRMHQKMLESDYQVQKYLSAQRDVNETAKWLQGKGYGDLVSGSAEIGWQVNWEKLNTLMTGESVGAELADRISFFQDRLKVMADAAIEIEKIKQEVKELSKEGKDARERIIEDIGKALQDRAQNQINVLTQINESIKSVQESVLSQMQENIAQQRQDRENEQTETELTDKRAQLAYLQGGGGSELDALKMQKEIDTAEQSYEDKLIDQTISEMQKANQQAADQRQEQIDIAQAQLDWWVTYQKNHEAERLWDEANKKALEQKGAEDQEALKQDLSDIGGSLSDLIKGDNNFATMTKTGMQDFEESLRKDGRLATIFDIANQSGWLNEINKSTSGGTKVEGDILSKMTVWQNEVLNDLVKTSTFNTEVWKDFLGFKVGNSVLAKDFTIGELGDSIARWAGALKGQYNETQTGLSQMEARWNQKFAEALKKWKEDQAGSGGGGGSKDPPTTDKAEYDAAWKRANAATGATHAEALIGSKNTYTEDVEGTIEDAPELLKAAVTYGDIENGKLYNYAGKYWEYDGNQWKSYTKDSKRTPFVQREINSYGTLHGELYEGLSEAFDNGIPVTAQYKNGLVNLNLVGDLPLFLPVEAHKDDDLTEKLKLLNIQSNKDNSNIVFLYNKKYYLWKGKGRSVMELQSLPPYIKKKLSSGSKNFFQPFELFSSGKFATGGLADFTGPAWLDGTKQSPELVLNARDTSNFIQLKDILSEIMRTNSTMHSPSTSTQPNSLYYDIDVNIDDFQAGDIDESVDRIRESIQRQIEELASYRNVNVVNNFH